MKEAFAPGRCSVVGAGGHAKVAIAALRAAGHGIEGVFDDNADLWGGSLLGAPIAGGVESALSSSSPLHLAIGANSVRQRLAGLRRGAWASAIHPRSLIEEGAVIGEGALIGIGAIVQVDAKIGRHVIVNSGAIVEHDCVIGDFAHLAPGSKLGGAVIIGEGALIGLGAQVLPGIEVGAWAVIGAGAVVNRPVEPGAVVVGSPARPLRR